MAIEAGNLGQVLVDEGMITAEQLAQANESSKTQGGSLGFNLALLGFVSEEEVARFIAMNHNLEFMDLSSAEVDPETLKILSQQSANDHLVLPIRKEGASIIMAVVDPSDERLAELAKEIKFKTNFGLTYVVSPESYIKISIEHYYAQLGTVEPSAAAASPEAPRYQEKEPSAVAANMQDIMEAAGEEAELTMLDEVKSDDDLATEGSPDDSVVIRMCNSMISEAVVKGCSDIHVEPFEKEFKIRFRIDGALREQPAPPISFRRAIIARFKVMAKLNIMERRKPQDGRIKIMVKGKKIDLRVATCPVQFGEKVVMRILDQDNLQTDLTVLGFEVQDLERFRKAIFSPYGIILVTGPTGSGKTVTLYSALSTVQDPEVNIMTAEDPIEYNLPGINQVPVDPAIGMSFPAALKSFLRCDPDIILVGEIRDIDTGSIAIKAAMTGHLVISTLHTNDAPSAVNRMVDMGLEPFYIGTAVKCIVAQRLVKRICKNCKESTTADPTVLEALGVDPKIFDGKEIFKGKGCDTCTGTGYKGRAAIYEVMPFTEEMIKIVFKNATAIEIKEQALKEGMNTLRISAVKKVIAGITTLEEVARNTAAD